MVLVKPKLLIVDDEPVIRNSLTEVFLRLGYVVRAASDGFSALSEIRNQIPDVLLSDMTMPGMSGFELLSVVRRLFPTIHVIAMSGLFTGNGSQPGVAADGFHEKATSVPHLLKLVEASQHEDRSSILGRRNAADPVWVSKNGHDSAGLEFITLTCPDCLRTFPESLNHAQDRICEAKCIHCSHILPYAIVPPPGAAFSMHF
jgi:CheY-like chemotaxis protein